LEISYDTTEVENKYLWEICPPIQGHTTRHNKRDAVDGNFKNRLISDMVECMVDMLGPFR
jgi:hypothetical protein